MASRNSCPNPVYYHSDVGAEWQSVLQSVSYCTESVLAARVKFARGGGTYPCVVRSIQERIHSPYGGCCCRAVVDGSRVPHVHTQPQTPQEGVTYARIQNSTQLGSIACGPGPCASSSRASCRRNRRSTRLPMGLLRSRTLRLRPRGLLRTGVLLQRHLPGRGSLGRMGLCPRLGRASLP
jgi:hypothetical protein